MIYVLRHYKMMTDLLLPVCSSSDPRLQEAPGQVLIFNIAVIRANL